MTPAASLVAPGDCRWILAYAILDSLASDMGRRRRQGLWVDHPDEMAGKRMLPVGELPQPDDLLKELHSLFVMELCEVIRADTCGRVQIGISNVVKLAKQYAH